MIAGRLVVVLVLLCVACSGGGGATATRSRPSGTRRTPASATPTSVPSPVSPSPVSPLPVAVRTESFVDTSRPTPPNGSAPGAPDRSIVTTIWYPADRRGSPLPLVLFVHGFGLRPATYAPLLERWAAAGYVVAAPAIPLLNGDAPGGPSEADLADAPADVRFAFDEVLRASSAPGPLHGLVDPRRVVVSGHSDGQAVAFALTADPCCRDSRLRGLMAFAGLLDVSGGTPLETGVPILHVVVDHDRYNDYEATVAFDRDRLPGPKVTVTLIDAEHEPPFDDPSDAHFEIVVRGTVAFLDAVLRTGSNAIAGVEVAMGSDPGIAAITVRS